MRITEIYKSIQGESSYAGLPCVFVRTTGCDLRCSWCDSEFTFTGGTRMTIDEIMAEVEKHDCQLIELTGGEPLLQSEIYELATRLADAGHTVLIETGGHRDISKLDPRVIDTYLGEYELRPGVIFKVERTEGDRLFIVVGSTRVQIFPEAEDKFFSRVPEADITFVKNEKGEVTELIFKQPEQVLKCKRINKPASATGRK